MRLSHPGTVQHVEEIKGLTIQPNTEAIVSPCWVAVSLSHTPLLFPASSPPFIVFCSVVFVCRVLSKSLDSPFFSLCWEIAAAIYWNIWKHESKNDFWIIIMSFWLSFLSKGFLTASQQTTDGSTEGPDASLRPFLIYFFLRSWLLDILFMCGKQFLSFPRHICPALTQFPQFF